MPLALLASGGRGDIRRWFGDGVDARDGNHDAGVIMANQVSAPGWSTTSDP
jgi:hypothetical protein